jgi:hypothetical protein
MILLWLLAAYLILPLMWQRWAARHPYLKDAPQRTRTKDGIEGDPVNLAVICSRDELTRAMTAAGWMTADKITMGSSTKIAISSIFGTRYVTAPVSNLYLFGRKQDLAFQQPAGKDASKRHHVRFWKAEQKDECGREVWFGAATYDSRVGLSHTTLQFTHHIDAEVDKERDKVITDLEKSGVLASTDWMDDFHTEREGKNGGGDRYRTDGRLAIATIQFPDATE